MVSLASVGACYDPGRNITITIDRRKKNIVCTKLPEERLRIQET